MVKEESLTQENLKHLISKWSCDDSEAPHL